MGYPWAPFGKKDFYKKNSGVGAAGVAALAGAAAGAAALAGFAEGLKLTISSFTIAPYGPVPCTYAVSIPFSSLNFFANGVINYLSPLAAYCVNAALEGAGLLAAAGASAGAAGVAAAGAFPTSEIEKLANDAIDPSSSTSTATGAPISTSAEPSGFKILAKYISS